MHALIDVPRIGLVLLKAPLPILILCQEELEEQGLLLDGPVVDFAIQSLLNVVFRVRELNGQRRHILVSFFILLCLAGTLAFTGFEEGLAIVVDP